MSYFKYFINLFHSFAARSDSNFTDIFQERIDGEDQFQQCAKGLGQGQFYWWMQRWCGPTVKFASRGSNGGREGGLRLRWEATIYLVVVSNIFSKGLKPPTSIGDFRF